MAYYNPNISGQYNPLQIPKQPGASLLTSLAPNCCILNSSGLIYSTLQGINISHLGKRKIIFKMPFWEDMLVPWRVSPLKALNNLQIVIPPTYAIRIEVDLFQGPSYSIIYRYPCEILRVYHCVYLHLSTTCSKYKQRLKKQKPPWNQHYWNTYASNCTYSRCPGLIELTLVTCNMLP